MQSAIQGNHLMQSSLSRIDVVVVVKFIPAIGFGLKFGMAFWWSHMVIATPPGGKLGQRHVIPQLFVAGTHLYSWVERVKCLVQEHNTVTPAIAQTIRTPRLKLNRRRHTWKVLGSYSPLKGAVSPRFNTTKTSSASRIVCINGNPLIVAWSC